jgi:hypothetical protein
MGQCQSNHALGISSLGADAHASKVQISSGSQAATRNASINTAATLHSSCQSESFSPIVEPSTITRRITNEARHVEKTRKDPLRHSAPPTSSMLYQRNPEILRRQSSWFTLSCGTGDSALSLNVGEYEYTAGNTNEEIHVRRRLLDITKDESATEDPTLAEDLSHLY